MANDSNASSSRRYRFSDDLIRSITTLVVFDSIFTVVGILINAWLLASILTSITLRSRLRNQLICCIASLHIIEDLVVGVFNIVARYLNFLYRWRLWMSLNCQTYHYMSTMNVAVNAAGDAMIVVLACVFLAQVLDFDPASKLSSRRLKIGKIALVLFPLVLALVAGPLTLVGISRWRNSKCMRVKWREYFIVESVFTVTPLCVAAVVIAAAVLFRCTRFGRGSITAQGNMGVHLMGSGREIDSSLAYIGAWLVCVASEICLLILWFELKDRFYRGWVIVDFCRCNKNVCFSIALIVPFRTRTPVIFQIQNTFAVYHVSHPQSLACKSSI